MKQQDFEKKYVEAWKLAEVWLAEAPRQREHDKFSLPDQYRQFCNQLSIAKHRRYSPQIIDRLNRLVIDCHQELYQHDARRRFQWLSMLFVEFPDALRRNRHLCAWAAAMFIVPGILVALACWFNEDFIYAIMGHEQVLEMESMYDPENREIGRDRDAGDDITMFGFYIKNNIGIAFRTFASGILFGVGAMFFLVFNGLSIGAVASHLTQQGFSETFWPFVIGHGSFELTAIVLAGAAGLKLGGVVLDPGPHSRVLALKYAAQDVMPIVIGMTVMLLIAAFLEAFWSSSSSLGNPVRYIAGTVFWVIVLLWMFSGKLDRSGGGS